MIRYNDGGTFTKNSLSNVLYLVEYKPLLSCHHTTDDILLIVISTLCLFFSWKEQPRQNANVISNSKDE